MTGEDVAALCALLAGLGWRMDVDCTSPDGRWQVHLNETGIDRRVDLELHDLSRPPLTRLGLRCWPSGYRQAVDLLVDAGAVPAAHHSLEQPVGVPAEAASKPIGGGF